MRVAFALVGASIIGGLVGLVVAYAYEKLLGTPWYR